MSRIRILVVDAGFGAWQPQEEYDNVLPLRGGGGDAADEFCLDCAPSEVELDFFISGLLALPASSVVLDIHDVILRCARSLQQVSTSISKEQRRLRIEAKIFTNTPELVHRDLIPEHALDVSSTTSSRTLFFSSIEQYFVSEFRNLSSSLNKVEFAGVKVSYLARNKVKEKRYEGGYFISYPLLPIPIPKHQGSLLYVGALLSEPLKELFPLTSFRIRGKSTADGILIDEIPTSERTKLKLLAHSLAILMQEQFQVDVINSTFTMGYTSQLVGNTLVNILKKKKEDQSLFQKSDSVGTTSASLIIVDRTLDLCTPLSRIAAPVWRNPFLNEEADITLWDLTGIKSTDDHLTKLSYTQKLSDSDAQIFGGREAKRLKELPDLIAYGKESNNIETLFRKLVEIEDDSHLTLLTDLLKLQTMHSGAVSLSFNLPDIIRLAIEAHSLAGHSASEPRSAPALNATSREAFVIALSDAVCNSFNQGDFSIRNLISSIHSPRVFEFLENNKNGNKPGSQVPLKVKLEVERMVRDWVGAMGEIACARQVLISIEEDIVERKSKYPSLLFDRASLFGGGLLSSLLEEIFNPDVDDIKQLRLIGESALEQVVVSSFGFLTSKLAGISSNLHGSSSITPISTLRKSSDTLIIFIVGGVSPQEVLAVRASLAKIEASKTVFLLGTCITDEDFLIRSILTPCEKLKGAKVAEVAHSKAPEKSNEAIRNLFL